MQKKHGHSKHSPQSPKKHRFLEHTFTTKIPIKEWNRSLSREPYRGELSDWWR